jgi:hypothetical protein
MLLIRALGVAVGDGQKRKKTLKTIHRRFYEFYEPVGPIEEHLVELMTITSFQHAQAYRFLPWFASRWKTLGTTPSLNPDM